MSGFCKSDHIFLFFIDAHRYTLIKIYLRKIVLLGILSNFSTGVYFLVNKCISYYYCSDDTLTKDIPVALNPLNADKPEAESSHQILTTTEVLYMNSEIGNKKPPPYKPTESTPQNVR